jgi:hypothetical protein
MVAAVAISSIVFLAVDLTCRRLNIMLLQVEIALEVKVTCKEEDVDKMEDALASRKRLLIEHSQPRVEFPSGKTFGVYNWAANCDPASCNFNCNSIRICLQFSGTIATGS